MPSSNIRDDLPSYYTRNSIVERLAEIVIQGLSQPRRTSVAPRVAQPVAAQAARPDETANQQQAPSTRPERHALPASPHRSYEEAERSASEYRERARTNRFRR
jgi:hypothetical protein